MTEAITQPNPQPTSPKPLNEAARKVEAGSLVQAQPPKIEELGDGVGASTPTAPERHTKGANELTGLEKTNGAKPLQRSRKRSTRRLKELQRRQADLVKPEKKTKPIPGTRLEPALHARWEAAVRESGLSSSKLVYVAVVEYLESAEMRSILGQMQSMARLVADTGNALLGSMGEVRDRLSVLDSMAFQLNESVAQQESKFVTTDDVEEMLARILNGAEEEEPGADEPETSSEGGQ